MLSLPFAGDRFSPHVTGSIMALRARRRRGSEARARTRVTCSAPAPARSDGLELSPSPPRRGRSPPCGCARPRAGGRGRFADASKRSSASARCVKTLPALCPGTLRAHSPTAVCRQRLSQERALGPALLERAAQPGPARSRQDGRRLAARSAQPGRSAQPAGRPQPGPTWPPPAPVLSHRQCGRWGRAVAMWRTHSSQARCPTCTSSTCSDVSVLRLEWTELSGDGPGRARGPAPQAKSFHGTAAPQWHCGRCPACFAVCVCVRLNRGSGASGYELKATS